MSDYQVRVAVLIVATIDGKIVLARRANTTYMDGYYGLPGGHLEADESLIEAAERELKEETGLTPGPESLKLFHVYQNTAAPSRPYVGFIFLGEDCSGSLQLEKDKADHIQLFALDELPEAIIPYHKEAIEHVGISQPINITYISPKS